MEVVPWKPIGKLDVFHPLKCQQKDHREMMEKILNSFSGTSNHIAGEWLPSVELSETKDSLIIKAELPGIKEKDIEVILSGDVLTIKGDKKQEKKEEREHYHFSDTFYGLFQRSFRIPVAFKADSIEAHFESNVLKITIPKTEEAKEKKIKVKIKVK